MHGSIGSQFTLIVLIYKGNEVQETATFTHWANEFRLQESIRKGDSRKVAIAILIKRHTSVSNIGIAERLGMGHDRSVSRLMKQGKTDETTQKQCKELEKM